MITDIEKSKLAIMYGEEKMTLEDIAKVYDVAPSTVWNCMVRFDIKRRTRVESFFIQLAKKKEKRRTEMEIDKEVEKKIEEKVKYLKKKIGANCTNSQVVELALSIADRVGGDWGFVCEYKHGGLKK